MMSTNNNEWWRGRRRWIVAGCFTFIVGLLLATRPYLHEHLHFQPPKYHHNRLPKGHNVAAVVEEPCRGARGTRLDDPASEDIPHPTYGLLNTTYPEPTFGSYDALELERTWMTFAQRYGPYGYGEDTNDYNLTRVNWFAKDWGRLQDRCMLDRSDRFHGNEFLQSDAPPRLRLLDDKQRLRPHTQATGRQAIVIRTWSSYVYMPEDYWNLRSIITEASLATHGDYTVFLLVDVKHEDGPRIHRDDDFYRQILEQSVPKEFQSIAVLFHQSLQRDWYKKTNTFHPNFQIMQPFQLFAHFYPEFDHFWQFEMDNRFLGNVGEMLAKFHTFGAREPYKQARERSSWTYMPGVQGTYAEFSSKVNATLKGGATVWGPVETNQTEPIGPKPVVDAVEDNFEWRVGDDADLLMFTALEEVSRFETHRDWVYKSWRGGFGEDNPPRFMSAPAQGRASRVLLEAIHTAQHEQGLWVPSEATLPSFALWHGLKLATLPIPKFQWPERDLTELHLLHNGEGGALPTSKTSADTSTHVF